MKAFTPIGTDATFRYPASAIAKVSNWPSVMIISVAVSGTRFIPNRIGIQSFSHHSLEPLSPFWYLVFRYLINLTSPFSSLKTKTKILGSSFRVVSSNLWQISADIPRLLQYCSAGSECFALNSVKRLKRSLRLLRL